MQNLEKKPGYLDDSAEVVKVLRSTDRKGDPSGGLTIYFDKKNNTYIYYIAGKYSLETLHESITETENHRRENGTLNSEQFALLDFTSALFDFGNIISLISRIIRHKSSGKWMKMFSIATPRVVKALNNVYEVQEKEPAFGEVDSYAAFLAITRELAASDDSNKGDAGASDTASTS